MILHFDALVLYHQFLQLFLWSQTEYQPQVKGTLKTLISNIQGKQ